MPYGVSKHKPYFGVGTYDGFGEVFDVNKNQWYQSPSVFSDDFSTDTGWTATSSTKVVASGTITITNTTTAQGYISKTFSTVVGKKYKIVGKNSIGSSSTQLVQIATSAHLLNSTLSTSGSFEFTFVADGVSLPIYLANGSTTSGHSASFSEVAIYPINNDGSVDTSSATPITESRNYLDAIVYADAGGQPTYIEQLPKTEYKDVIKANEYQGKNACTAWVNFDGTTTPPTIRDSYNVSAVIRTATGVFDIYFKTPMDNINYSLSNTVYATSAGNNDGINAMAKSKNKVKIDIATIATILINPDYADIQIYGGKD